MLSVRFFLLKVLIFVSVSLLLLIGNTGFAQSFQFESQLNQGWTESENWQLTFQRSFGQDVSGTWIMEQISNGAILLESPNQRAFLLIREGEFSNMKEGKEALEEAKIEGQMRSIPNSDVRPLGQNGQFVSLVGTIGNKVFRGQRIHFESRLGQHLEIMVVGSELSWNSGLSGAAHNLAHQLMKVQSEELMSQN